MRSIIVFLRLIKDKLAIITHRVFRQTVVRLNTLPVDIDRCCYITQPKYPVNLTRLYDMSLIIIRCLQGGLNKYIFSHSHAQGIVALVRFHNWPISNRQWYAQSVFQLIK